MYLLAGVQNYTLYLVSSIICLALLFLAAALTVVIVFIQPSNSEGIQGITASSETFFGKNKGQSTEAKLKKLTWICLAVIGVLSILVYIVGLLNP